MIVCTGEILADMIGKTENGMVCYERYAGGAPFNVACGLKKLGSACGFCGCVGDDLIGSFLENFARAQQFDYLRIARDKTRNTTKIRQIRRCRQCRTKLPELQTLRS